MKTKIAVIGAGISGLVLANELKDHADIVVLEKSRGVGGRMSTRYADPLYFDHGAQFFTARSRRFRKFLQPFLHNGHVDVWHARVTTLAPDSKQYKRIWFEPHYVGTPHMNSLCNALADNVNIKFQTTIDHLLRDNQQWKLLDQHQNSVGSFDIVISTAPAIQSQQMFPSTFEHQTVFDTIKLSGCYTLMGHLKDKPKLTWDAAVVKDSPIGWIAFNHSKPQRDARYTTLIMHSSNAWAEEQMEDHPDQIQQQLLDECCQVSGMTSDTFLTTTLHHWRYANVEQSSETDYLFDPAMNLACCGDGYVGNRVEAAFQSACRLANRIKKNSNLKNPLRRRLKNMNWIEFIIGA